MLNLIRTTAASVALVLCSALLTSAYAASVTLNPSSASVGEGGSFTVDLYMDASDIGVIDPNIYIGEVIIDFDSTLASYDGFAINAPVVLDSGPTISFDGDQQKVRVEFSEFSFAGNVGLIGTFSFTALGSAGSSIDFGAEDPFLLGSFYRLLESNTQFTPSFTGASVQIAAAVPVPAAIWLMLSALGVIGLRGRRRSR